MNKSKLLIPSIVIVLIIAFFIVGSSNNLFTTTSTGFRVTGISPDVTTIKPDGTYEYFYVNVVADGSRESIVGYITDSDFNKNGYDSYKMDYPLKITMTAKTDISYDIYNDKVQIKSYDWTKDSFWKSCNVEDTICKVKCVGLNSWCINGKTEGVMGHLGNPSMDMEGTITVTVDGKSETKTVTNDDKLVTFKRDGETLAQFSLDGGLITGNPTPNQDNYVPLLIDGSWDIVSKSTWDEYANQKSIVESTGCSEIPGHSYEIGKCSGAMDNKVDDVKDAYTDLKSEFGSTELDGHTTEIVKSGDKFKVNTAVERNIINQVYSIRVKAESLGVLSPSSKVQIIDKDKLVTQCTELTSGETTKNNVDVTIKNIGDVDSSYTFKLSNCFFEISGASPVVALDSGKTKTVTLPLDVGTLSEAKKELCTLKVLDKNDDTKYDTATVCVESKTPVYCTPLSNATKVNFGGFHNCLVQCNSEGTKEDILFCCGEGNPLVISEDNSYVCEKQNCARTGEAKVDFEDGCCSPLHADADGICINTPHTSDLIQITVSIIVGAVVFFILKSALEGMGGGSAGGFSLNIGLILAVIGGFAAGFLVFTWWSLLYTYYITNFGGLFK